MPAYEMELAPLRTFNDFFLDFSKFQLPNFKDLEKWGNRVAQNLIYYQTNYFSLIIFTLFIFILVHPMKMLIGGLSMYVMYELYCYIVTVTSLATKFKKDHPLLGVALLFSGVCLIHYLLSSLLVFLFGIAVPISLIFIHASLRLRNIKNKIVNIKRVASNKTPMGIFLDLLGVEPSVIL